MPDANQRRRNPVLWAGAVLTLLGVLSNGLYFVTSSGERIFPWLTLLVAAAGIILLLAGLWRAFGQPQVFRGKITGSILAVVGLPLFAFNVWGFFHSRDLPASAHAPQVGQKAPDFTLTKTSGQAVSLAQLLSAPIDTASGKAPKAVLLIFYRGDW
ncbi:MAG TPA: hypothetical protein VI488_05470 [Candidatus Angelobacter sp.]